jgi:hypothetical protein
VALHVVHDQLSSFPPACPACARRRPTTRGATARSCNRSTSSSSGGGNAWGRAAKASGWARPQLLTYKLRVRLPIDPNDARTKDDESTLIGSADVASPVYSKMKTTGDDLIPGDACIDLLFTGLGPDVPTRSRSTRAERATSTSPSERCPGARSVLSRTADGSAPAGRRAPR